MDWGLFFWVYFEEVWLYFGGIGELVIVFLSRDFYLFCFLRKGLWDFFLKSKYLEGFISFFLFGVRILGVCEWIFELLEIRGKMSMWEVGRGMD